MSEPALEGPPEDEIARIEGEISARRERVAVSLGDLNRGINDALSWRHLAGAHPIAWIFAGVCLGFVVGGGAGRRRGPE